MEQTKTIAHLLGSRIRYLRLLRGMTQEELGAAAGMTAKQMSRIERGTSSPKVSGLDKISKALETSPFNLFLYDFIEDYVMVGVKKFNIIEACLPGDQNMGVPVRMGTWILNWPGAESVWSEAFFRLLGYEPFMVRPSLRLFLSCVEAGMRPEVEKYFASADNDDCLRSMVVRVCTKNGGQRIIMLNKDKIWFEFNKVPMIQFRNVKDVTECLTMNRALAASLDDLEIYIEDKRREPIARMCNPACNELDMELVIQGLKLCRSAIESSPAPVVITDTKTRLTLVNKAFLKTWRYESACEVHGEHLSRFICPSISLDKVIKQLRTMGIWKGRINCVTRYGDRFSTHKLASVVHDGSDRLIGFASIFFIKKT